MRESTEVPSVFLLKAGGLHIGVGGVANAMHPLILEAVEPALRRRVVPPLADEISGEAHDRINPQKQRREPGCNQSRCGQGKGVGI